MIIRSPTRARAQATPRHYSAVALVATYKLRQKPQQQPAREQIRPPDYLVHQLVVLLQYLEIPHLPRPGLRPLHQQHLHPHSHLEALLRLRLALLRLMPLVLVPALLAASLETPAHNREEDCLVKSKDSRRNKLPQRLPPVVNLPRQATYLATRRVQEVAVHLAISLRRLDRPSFKVSISHQKPQMIYLQLLLRPWERRNHFLISARIRPPPLHPQLLHHYLATHRHQARLLLLFSQSQLRRLQSLVLPNPYSHFPVRTQRPPVLLLQLRHQRPLIPMRQNHSLE